ncbi:glucose-6-phosphate dehydrogenase, partial [Cylindrospermopsis raciborskii CS-506_A]|nr:glucose-6-phosphate dehydrogenase [Cylindrospermopsis raciborskii CS-506_A]
MSSRIISVEPFDMVVFGATGDLAARKLMPALFRRDVAGQIPAEARIIGVSRRPTDDAAYLDWVKGSLRQHVPAEELTDENLARFMARLA